MCGYHRGQREPVADLPLSDYVPLVNLIGVHFQIRDDYMNLQSTQVCFLLLFHLSRSFI